jgi:putative transposase
MGGDHPGGGSRSGVAAVAKRHASASRRSTPGARFGGLQARDVVRLRQLEAENGRWKKLVAERDLEIEVMKEVAAKNGDVPARRQQIGVWPGAWPLARRACTLFSVARSALEYRSRKGERRMRLWLPRA